MNVITLFYKTPYQLFDNITIHFYRGLTTWGNLDICLYAFKRGKMLIFTNYLICLIMYKKGNKMKAYIKKDFQIFKSNLLQAHAYQDKDLTYQGIRFFYINIYQAPRE